MPGSGTSLLVSYYGRIITSETQETSTCSQSLPFAFPWKWVGGLASPRHSLSTPVGLPLCGMLDQVPSSLLHAGGHDDAFQQVILLPQALREQRGWLMISSRTADWRGSFRD